jgi:hypothetical protein
MNIQALFFRILRLIAAEWQRGGVRVFEVSKDGDRIVLTFFQS